MDSHQLLLDSGLLRKEDAFMKAQELFAQSFKGSRIASTRQITGIVKVLEPDSICGDCGDGDCDCGP